MVGRLFAQSVFFLLLVVVSFLIFKAVQTGIGYNWRNIPFYIANMLYEAPERVRWVDPWREDKGLGTRREERGFFKTREALEIYVKKYHDKTSEDLQQFWHDNPSESNGLEIPSWAERAYPKIILFAIACVAVLGCLPMLIIIPAGGATLLNSMREVDLFCVDSLEDIFAAGALLLLFGTWILNYWYAMWQANGFRFSYAAITTFVFGWLCFYLVFLYSYAFDDQVVDRHINFMTAEMVFFIPETVVTIVRTYLNGEQGIGVDIARLIKRFRGKDEHEVAAPKVWVVSGCPKDDAMMHQANGVYYKSPCVHIQDDIAWNRIVRGDRVGARGGARKHSGNRHPESTPVEVGERVQIRFGLGVRKRLMMGTVQSVDAYRRTVAVSFGVELGESDGAPVYVKIDWSARPGRQLFSFKIMRVRTPSLRNQPHWVLVDNRNGQCLGGLAGQVRYAARDMSGGVLEEPPSSGWHSLSENPGNQAVPSVVSWDAAHFSVDREARLTKEKTTRTNRKIIGILYLVWVCILVAFVVSTSSNSACTPVTGRHSADIGTVLWPVGVIVWLELATPLMAGIGLKMSPLSICLFNFVARVLLILFPTEEWFVAACIIYVALSAIICKYWASEVYPLKSIREILKDELRGALPQWMFSGEEVGAGGGDDGDGDGDANQAMSGANFVEQKVIQDAVFAPFLKLADYLDCLVSDLSAVVVAKGRGGGHRQQSRVKVCCRKFLGSPSFVLVYLTLLFGGALWYVYEMKDTYQLQETVFQFQYELGIFAMLLVSCMGSTLRFQHAYDYYGHHINAIPHHNVLLETLPMMFSFTLLGFMLRSVHQQGNQFVAIGAFIAPWAIATTIWAVRNWAAEDYALFFDAEALAALGWSGRGGKKDRDARGRVKSPLAKLKGSLDPRRGLKQAHAALNSLYGLPATVWRQLVKKRGTILGMLIGPLGMALLYTYLTVGLASDIESFHPWMSGLALSAIEIVFFTYLLFTAYFKQFKLNPALIVVILGFVFLFQFNLGGVGNVPRCIPVNTSSVNTSNPLLHGEVICSNAYNKNQTDGIVGMPCSKKNESLVCGTSPRTTCRPEPLLSIKYGYPDGSLGECDCIRWKPFGFDVGWTRLFYGNNCDYKMDGFSAGAPVPWIWLILSTYWALVCGGLGLYKWYLFDLRPAAFSKIRVNLFVAAAMMTVWAFYFLIWGADELNKGRHYILGIPEEKYFIINFKIGAAAYWAVSVGFLFLFSHWVTHEFSFRGWVKVLVGVILLGFFAYIISQVFVANSSWTVYSLFRWLVYLFMLGDAGIFLKHLTGSGDVHYPEMLFPIFSVDPRTHKLVSTNDATRAGLRFFIWLAVLGVSCKIMDSLGTDAYDMLQFYGAVVATLLLIAHRGFTSRLQFTTAWSQVRNNTTLIDRLRAQTIEMEMKDVGNGTQKTPRDAVVDRGRTGANQSSGVASYKPKVCVEAAAALQTLISNSDHRPWRLPDEAVKFDTHQACLQAVGEVPAKMPRSWSCFTKVIDTADEITHTVVDRALDDDVSDDDENIDRPEMLVSGAGHMTLNGVYTYVDSLRTGDASDGFPIFQLVNGELGTGCYLTTRMIDEGWGPGAELYWVLLQGSTLIYKCHAGLTAILNENQHDLETGRRQRGQARNRDTGLKRKSNFDKLRKKIQKMNKLNNTAAKNRDRAGSTASRASVQSSSSIVSNATTIFGTATKDGLRGLDYPPEFGWHAAISEAEPAPGVMLTELTDWTKVYRSASGLTRFQTSMSRVLTEEQRMVARFRILLCKSAEGQYKVEGAVLWNFVSTCVPKLEQITMEEAIEEYLEEHRLDAEFDEKKKKKKKKQNIKARASSSEHVLNPLEQLHSMTKEDMDEKKRREALLELDENTFPGCTSCLWENMSRFTVVNRFWKGRRETRIPFSVYKKNTIRSIKEKLQKQTGIRADKMALILVTQSSQHPLASPGNSNECTEGKVGEGKIGTGMKTDIKLGIGATAHLKMKVKRLHKRVSRRLQDEKVCTRLEDDKVIGDYNIYRGPKGDILTGGESTATQILLVENYSLDDMSAYEFRKWLFEKENAEDPRKVSVGCV
jgi:hypothetical protein